MKSTKSRSREHRPPSEAELNGTSSAPVEVGDLQSLGLDEIADDGARVWLGATATLQSLADGEHVPDLIRDPAMPALRWINTSHRPHRPRPSGTWQEAKDTSHTDSASGTCRAARPRPHGHAVWGERDSALKVDTFGEAARRAAGADTIHRLPAKHFLQEDQADAVADLIATFVSS